MITETTEEVTLFDEETGIGYTGVIVQRDGAVILGFRFRYEDRTTELVGFEVLGGELRAYLWDGEVEYIDRDATKYSWGQVGPMEAV